jgi:hypothetical protein
VKGKGDRQKNKILDQTKNIKEAVNLVDRISMGAGNLFPFFLLHPYLLLRS